MQRYNFLSNYDAIHALKVTNTNVFHKIIEGNALRDEFHVLGVFQNILQATLISAMLSHKSTSCLCLHFLLPMGATFRLPQYQLHNEANPQGRLSFLLSSAVRWAAGGHLCAFIASNKKKVVPLLRKTIHLIVYRVKAKRKDD